MISPKGLQKARVIFLIIFFSLLSCFCCFPKVQADTNITLDNKDKPITQKKESFSISGQNFSYSKGKTTASADVSKNTLAGNFALSDQQASWLWKLALKAGILNDNFTFWLSGTAGYAPNPTIAAWLKVNTEFNQENREHTQTFLNLGWKPRPNWDLQITLDYLNKRTHVSAWDKSQDINQYGAGLKAGYQLYEVLKMSGFFLHYQTKGKEYGHVGEYESTTDGIYHYGHAIGALRGGLYNELGIDLSYTHPTNGLLLNGGVSEVLRDYEAMLDHPLKSEANCAFWVGMGYKDILSTGIDLDSSMRMEFASQKRGSWRVGLKKSLGSAVFSLYYEQIANDLTDSDQRWWLSLSMPLQDFDFIKDTADQENQAESALKKPNFQGAWVQSPIQGMGQPQLKVAEQIIQTKDLLKVDLSSLDKNVSISKGIMTIAGLPTLKSKDTLRCIPSCAASAFSLDTGKNVIEIDLVSLPAPNNLWGSFLQENGSYTLVYLTTSKGSVHVTGEDHRPNIPASMVDQFLQNPSFLENTPPTAKISGKNSLAVGKSAFYSGKDSNDDTGISAYRWKVTGPATITGSGAKIKLTVKKAGEVTISLKVRDLDGLWSGWVTKKLNPQPQASINGPDSLDVGQSGVYSAQLSNKSSGITKYQWKTTGPATISGSGKKVTIKVTGEGEITISLRMKNKDGVWSDWTEKNLNSPLTARITGPDNLSIGQSVEYSGKDSGNGATISAYEWKIKGSAATLSGSGVNVTVTPSKSGAVTISLRVKDNTGSWSDWAEKNLKVLPPAQITGPDSLLIENTSEYLCESPGNTTGITDYEWKVSGPGSIVESGNKTNLTANGGGTITLSCRVQDETGIWSEWTEKQVSVIFDPITTQAPTAGNYTELVGFALKPLTNGSDSSLMTIAEPFKGKLIDPNGKSSLQITIKDLTYGSVPVSARIQVKFFNEGGSTVATTSALTTPQIASRETITVTLNLSSADTSSLNNQGSNKITHIAVWVGCNNGGRKYGMYQQNVTLKFNTP